MNKRLHLFLTTIIVASIIVGCNTAPPATITLPAPTPTSTIAVSIPQSSDTALLDAAGLDFAEKRVIDVYNHVAPSVVNVTTRVLRRGFFFQAIPEEGAGSGFVMDKEGHIVTNYHVVEGAETIEVTLGDVTLPAQLVGSDSHTDIAVIKIDASPDLLVPVTFGQSSTLQVGQRAIAIGNPFGQFERTLTTGVISALNRTLETDDGREINGVIQTDASINRGNSGGPLLDSAGRMIGINSAIFSPSGTSAGVGFAIPVDTLQRVLPDLLSFGYYRRAWLGIHYAYELTPELADALQLSTDHGLLLVEMYDGSPLNGAGVRGAQQQAVLGNQLIYIGGDVLVSIDDHAANSLNDLDTLLETDYEIGQQVTISIVRDGQPMTIDVTLVEEPR